MAESFTTEKKRILCKKMAKNLPTLRIKAGLSQDELSERLGFSRQTISAIETGKRNMQWSTFTAIALFFAKDEEIKQMMFLVGILDSTVMEILDVQKP